MAAAAFSYVTRPASHGNRPPNPSDSSNTRPRPKEHRTVEADRDTQLILATAQGDLQAFETIYDRYASAIFGLALNTLADRGAAEEAVQEIFLRVWRHAGTFDVTRSFVSWLYRIAHNYCIDELRRQRVRPRTVYEDDAAPILAAISDDTDVGALALHAERSRIVAEALQQLPVEQHQAIKLAYFGGLTLGEIAGRTGSPVGTIKTRMRIGLQKLRQILRDEELIESS